MMISPTALVGVPTAVSQSARAWPRPTPRMLDIAEQIGTLIEAGVWTPQTFPISTELERRFHAKQETVRGALRVNVARGQVRRYADPDSGHPRPRYLPCPPAPSIPPATGPERVAAVVAERVGDGTWNADNFPTTRQIARELGCGHDTVNAGMKIAAARGVVRKVKVVSPRVKRGRIWAWRPASAPAELPVYERLDADIRAGVLTGPLPPIRQMGRELRVNPQKVSDAYRRLAEARLIHRVTVPRKRGATSVWHVLDGSEPYGRLPERPRAQRAPSLAMPG